MGIPLDLLAYCNDWPPRCLVQYGPVEQKMHGCLTPHESTDVHTGRIHRVVSSSVQQFRVPPAHLSTNCISIAATVPP